MSIANVKGGLVIGLVPAGLLAGILVFLNLYPIRVWTGAELKIDSYGWPRTCGSSTMVLTNGKDIFDEGGVGNPNAVPEWNTVHEIESDELRFNIIWCSVIILLVWLATAFVYNSRVKWGWAEQWESWWRV